MHASKQASTQGRKTPHASAADTTAHKRPRWARLVALVQLFLHHVRGLSGARTRRKRRSVRRTGLSAGPPRNAKQGATADVPKHCRPGCLVFCFCAAGPGETSKPKFHLRDGAAMWQKGLGRRHHLPTVGAELPAWPAHAAATLPPRLPTSDAQGKQKHLCARNHCNKHRLCPPIRRSYRMPTGMFVPKRNLP